MAKDLDLKVRISAELGEIKSALAGLEGQLAKVSNNTQKSSQTLTSAFDGIKRSVVGLAAAWASLATAKQIIDLADQAAMLNARLKLVTKSTEEYVKAQGALAQIADSTRSSLAETIDLYSRLARSTESLGASQDTLLSVTQTVNQAVQLSGVSAEAANAALTQLGQGLASGTLRGEELNSVLEQTPRLAQAIAEGMGITVGELRAVAAEGKITADQVVNALVAQKGAVEQEFSQLPLTVGQSMTLLKNSLLQSVGDLDKATGATSGLAAIVKGFADFLSSGVLQEAFLSVFGYWSSFLSDLAQDFQQAFGIISSVHKKALAAMGIDRDAYVGAMIDSVGFIVDAWSNLPSNIRAFIQIIVTEAAYMFDRVLLSARTFKDKVTAIFTDDTMAAAEARFQQELENIKTARDESVAAIMNERDAHIAAGEQAKKRYADEKAARDAAATTVGAPEKVSALPQREDPKEEARRQKQAEKDREEQEKLAEQRRRDTAQLQIDMARIEGRGADARMLELQEKHRQAMARLQETGNTEGVKLLQKMFPKEVAQAQFQDIQDKFDKLLDDLKAKEESLANRVRIGDITQGQADRELEAARAGVLGQGGDLVSQQQDLAGANPELTAQLQANQTALEQNKASATGLKLAYQELANSTDQLQQNFASNTFQMLGDGIGQAFGDIITGAKSASQAFKDMAISFAQSLAKMYAEWAAKKALMAILDAFGGGKSGGGGAGGFMSLFGGVKHTGGIAGMGGTIRKVPGFLFAGAPRYHSGGVAGLKPGEVPAILKRGEEVLTQQDPRHAANGGGQQGGGVRIINTIDPNMVSDYMSSSQGEQVLVNVIQRNAGVIRQAMA